MPARQTGLSSGLSTCVAFNQIHTEVGGVYSVPVEAGLTNFPIATTHFFVDPTTPVGTVLQFTWRTTPTSSGLDWFGTTNAPGVSITVVPDAITSVPEPTSAALAGAGLLGLAVATRRRS